MTQHKLLTINNTSSSLVSPFGQHSGVDITLQNVNPVGYIYVGGEGVTATDYGYRIAVNNAISFELPGNDALYVRGSEGSMVVAILTTGLESGS